ncbi:MULTISPECIES: HK97-gp10 family putative phage morphogenesis protein [Aeromonas]|uniref:HK97-gp10 family putative phage morphogenesis protein n=1 Tax=Aeromonas caviae TaxID=648 RepID=UPI0022015903|nr:HK97-gp10 family putative phage morphogenesis protein [Aeromonas caviae]BDS29257.1 hypothetical protein KAM479c_09810 [Aeromonas caviae]
MTISFDVSGFDELESQLANLDLAVQKKVLREVARTSAQPVLADTQLLYEQNWDHDTGQLGESIKLRVSIPRNPTWADVVASVGVFKNYKVQVAAGKAIDAPVYAYWLEHGTREHSLASGASLKKHSDSAKAQKRAHLRRDRPGQEMLIHPGIEARPFIRPAFDRHIEDALEIQRTTLSAAIDKALR